MGIAQRRWKRKKRKPKQEKRSGGRKRRKNERTIDDLLTRGTHAALTVSLNSLTRVFEIKEQDWAVHSLKGSLCFDKHLSMNR